MWRGVALLMLFELLIARVRSMCPGRMASHCNQSVNQNIYPSSFLVFGAYAGQLYTVGNVVMLVAKFPDGVCDLPDPTTLGPDCRPIMHVSLFTEDATCYNVSAASTSQLEVVFGFSFADDAALETDNGVYNHWVFPLYIVSGMATSRLEVKSLIIPPECNSERAVFENTNKISKSVSITPSIKIDTQAPAVVSIHTGKAPGVYTVGDVINIVVEFSKDVQFSTLPNQFSRTYIGQMSKSIPYGVPYLELNSKALAPLRGYDESSQSKRRLSFLYEVGPGEETPAGRQLDILPNGFELNGGSIVSVGTGLDVNLSTVPIARGEGSMSFYTSNRIYIAKQGEKFPPLRYDPAESPDTEVVSVRRNGRTVTVRKQQRATTVTVDLRLNALLDVDEVAQRFRADVTLSTQWTDHRLRNPQSPAVTEYGSDILADGGIWSPYLLIANRRDAAAGGVNGSIGGAGGAAERTVSVYNTGRVVVVERHVGLFSAALDARDFPFDAHALSWQLRSARHPRTLVKFAAAGEEEARNASRLLGGVPDARWALSGYAQRAAPLHAGPHRGFDTLVVTVRAERLAAAHTATLVAPLCAVGAALALAAQQDPAAAERLAAPLAGAAAAALLSLLAAAAAPRVGYLTRLHLLFLETYLLAAAQLAAALYVRAVGRARRALAAAEVDARRTLRDAHFVAKLLAPAPREVTIAPAGGGGDDPGGGGGGGDWWAAVKAAALLADPEPPPPPSTTPVAVAVPAAAAFALPPRAHCSRAHCSAGKWESLEDLAEPAEAGPCGGAAAAAAAAAALLDSDAVRALRGARWAAGPVPVLCGLGRVTAANGAAWAAHAAAVDGALRVALPAAWAVGTACILCLDDLPGLIGPHWAAAAV